MPEFAFARFNLRQTNSSFAQKSQAMKTACRELNPSSDAGQKINSPHTELGEIQNGRGGFAGGVVRGIFGAITTGASVSRGDISLGAPGMLFGSNAEKAFASELTKIKAIKDPIDRTAAVVELVQRYQGPYDEKRGQAREDRLHTQSPGLTLRRAGRGDVGGVCRDFARLLDWSLTKVAQPTGYDRRNPQKTLIDSRFETSDQLDHAYVSVKVSIPDGKGSAKVQEIHFDSTWNAGQNDQDPHSTASPAALPVRHHVWDRAKYLPKCHEIVRCLNDKASRNRTSSGAADAADAVQ